jgi:hypothetical protein
MFRDGGQYMDSEPVRLRHIDGDEFHVAVHQIGDESYIARKPVQTGDDKDCPALAAFGQGGEQLRPIRVFLSALDFNELRSDMSTVPDISTDGFALRIHAKAGDSLLVG